MIVPEQIHISLLFAQIAIHYHIFGLIDLEKVQKRIL